MDFIPNQDEFLALLTKYGSFALFGLLALGIIVLPVPDESLMVLAGILIHDGCLSPAPTMIAAYTGSMTGITISYLIGRTAGHYFLNKLGPWIGINEQRIKATFDWYEKYGKWTLVVGYFLPGIRHLTGILAGTSGLSFKHFALFAYVGAFIWVSTFLFIGYFFGPYWVYVFKVLEKNVNVLIGIGLVLLFAFLFYRTYRKNKRLNNGK